MQCETDIVGSQTDIVGSQTTSQRLSRYVIDTLKANHGKLEANLHKLILLRTRHSPPAYTRSHLGL